jgi:hypothetical protein
MEVSNQTAATVTVNDYDTGTYFANQDNDAIEFNLPTDPTDLTFCFGNGQTGGTPIAQAITINANNGYIIVDGTAERSFTSSGDGKDNICIVGLDSGYWKAIGYQGTWSDGGGTDYTADANCQGAWLFADDLTDESGEGNTLTPTGDPAYSATYPSGYSTGKSRDYDGAGDYDSRATGSLSANFPGKAQKTEMSLCLWINRNQEAAATNIVGLGGNSWALGATWKVSGWNELFFHADDGTDEDWVVIDAEIPDDTWIHYCIVLMLLLRILGLVLTLPVMR